MARKSRSARMEPGEHFTKLIRTTMETPAWRALSPTAQALYPWLKLEWRGPQANNNGRIRLSVRQAEERLGVTRRPAIAALHDLQAKGFLHQTEAACLGTEGMARGPAFEITELLMPGQDRPRALFKEWQDGADYPVPRPAQPSRRKQKPGDEKAPEPVTNSHRKRASAVTKGHRRGDECAPQMARSDLIHGDE